MYHIIQDPNELDYIVFLEIHGKFYHDPTLSLWSKSISGALKGASFANWSRDDVSPIWFDKIIYSSPILPTVDTHPELFL